MLQTIRHRWDTLSTNQKIGVTVVALLVAYAMFSMGNLVNPARLLAVATIVFVALPVHEYAHAAMAVALGDDTPKWQGRYTLNPIAHIDPVGALLILFTGFGWAKPVQWNPRNIDVDLRFGSLLIAIAGPLSNLLLALLAILILRFDPVPNAFLGQSLQFFIYINVLLFVFNMIPVPPLDGSHVLFALLPGDTMRLRAQLSQFGFLILIAVIFLAPGIIQVPTTFVLNALYGLV